ncbi:GST N-terminal domain-containing protein [Balamuthia mandrillaris]
MVRNFPPPSQEYAACIQSEAILPNSLAQNGLAHVMGHQQESRRKNQSITFAFYYMMDSNPLIFYDISSPIEPRSYAPNPSKTRLALSFKRVPFKTTWVDILDIPDVRKGLGCPAVRKLDDGSDFYTLPMLQDPASGRVVGDSFEIANYLEDMFPDSGGCLFPSDSTCTGLDYESPNKDTVFFAPLTSNQGSKNEAYARFNVHVDATFTANMAPYGQYLPFNPKSAEAVKALFAKRAHLSSWDDICIQGEAREPLKEAFKVALTSLAQLYMVHETGPYLEGEKANYADLIVGGWLNMLSIIMPEEEWKDFRTWHGGVFAQLHDALQENYFECK